MESLCRACWPCSRSCKQPRWPSLGGTGSNFTFFTFWKAIVDLDDFNFCTNEHRTSFKNFRCRKWPILNRDLKFKVWFWDSEIKIQNMGWRCDLIIDMQLGTINFGLKDSWLRRLIFSICKVTIEHSVSKVTEIWLWLHSRCNFFWVI